jgi:uncharacterized protein (DUF3820 family)
MSKSEKPKQPYRMRWGKYNGMILDHVPTNYLNWLLQQEGCPKPVIEYMRNYKNPLTEKSLEEEKDKPKHPNYYGLFRKNKPDGEDKNDQ